MKDENSLDGSGEKVRLAAGLVVSNQTEEGAVGIILSLLSLLPPALQPVPLGEELHRPLCHGPDGEQNRTGYLVIAFPRQAEQTGQTELGLPAVVGREGGLETVEPAELGGGGGGLERAGEGGGPQPAAAVVAVRAGLVG